MKMLYLIGIMAATLSSAAEIPECTKRWPGAAEISFEACPALDMKGEYLVKITFQVDALTVEENIRGNLIEPYHDEWNGDQYSWATLMVDSYDKAPRARSLRDESMNDAWRMAFRKYNKDRAEKDIIFLNMVQRLCTVAPEYLEILNCGASYLATFMAEIDSVVPLHKN